MPLTEMMLIRLLHLLESIQNQMPNFKLKDPAEFLCIIEKKLKTTR